ncbi:hypothetical protein BGX20_006118, partial [Mortierella sp. AD010]
KLVNLPRWYTPYEVHQLFAQIKTPNGEVACHSITMPFNPFTKRRYPEAFVYFSNMRQWENVRHRVFEIDGKQTQWVNPKDPTCHYCGSPDHFQPNCDLREKRKILQANRRANTAAMQKPIRTPARVLVTDSQQNSAPTRSPSHQTPTPSPSSQRNYKTALDSTGNRVTTQGNAPVKGTYAEAASSRGGKLDKGKAVDRGSNAENGRQNNTRTQKEQQTGTSTSGMNIQQKTWQQEHAELRQIVNSFRTKLDNQIQMWQEQLLRQETRMNAMASTLEALDSKIDALLGLRKHEEYDISQHTTEPYDKEMTEAPVVANSGDVVPATPLAPIDDTVPSVAKRLCSVRDDLTPNGGNSIRKYDAEQLVAKLDQQIENRTKEAAQWRERATLNEKRAEEAEKRAEEAAERARNAESEWKKSVRLHQERDEHERRVMQHADQQSEVVSQEFANGNSSDSDL